MNTPLIKVDICDPIQSYVSSCSPKDQRRIDFANNRPLTGWLHAFVLRTKLNFLAVRMVEQTRSDVTPKKVEWHFALLENLTSRYHYVDSRRVF